MLSVGTARGRGGNNLEGERCASEIDRNTLSSCWDTATPSEQIRVSSSTTPAALTPLDFSPGQWDVGRRDVGSGLGDTGAAELAPWPLSSP